MGAQQIVFVTGMSGAGKSTAARALEDLEFWCVDNLPAPLLEKLVQLTAASGAGSPRLAVVCDLRDAALVDAFPAAFQAARAVGRGTELLFLEASDEVLLGRYQRTGRPHPLARPPLERDPVDADEGAIRAALAEERARLAPLRARATEVIDTSEMTVHELRRQVVRRFGAGEAQHLEVGLLTFTYPPGPPPEVDLVFDARCAPVGGVGDEGPERGLDRLIELLAFLFPLYQREGKTYLTIGLGGGVQDPRAEAMSRALRTRLEPLGIATRLRADASTPIASARSLGDDAGSEG